MAQRIARDSLISDLPADEVAKIKIGETVRMGFAGGAVVMVGRVIGVSEAGVSVQWEQCSLEGGSLDIQGDPGNA